MDVCRYFQLGRCVNGEACRFLHPTTTASSIIQIPSPNTTLNADARLFEPRKDGPSNTQKRQPCIFFLQGTCKRGVFCRFEHELQPAPPAAHDTRSTMICKFFLRNACAKGSACPYIHTESTANGGNRESSSHVLPASPALRPEPPIEPPLQGQPMDILQGDRDASFTRAIGGATVTFDAGAAVSSVSLPSDFSTISMTNIPAGKSVQDVCSVIQSYGFLEIPPTSVTLNSKSPTSPQSTQVKINDPSFATRFLRATGPTIEIGGSPVSISVVQLGGDSESGTNRLQLTGVTCTWHQPSKIAYLEYFSTTQARAVVAEMRKRVSQLDGRRVTFAPQGSSSWVTVSNINVRTSKEALKRVLPTNLRPLKINMGEYSHVYSAVQLEDRVRNSLQECGTLLEWTVTPQADGSKIKAIAKFSDLAVARKAVNNLDNTPIDRTSKDKLRVQHLVSVKLPVSQRVLQAVRSQLNALVKASWESDYVSIKIYDNPTKPYTQIRISGQNKDSVARVKLSIEKVLSGRIVGDGNTRISHQVLVDIMNRHNVTIVQDRRKMVLRLYGDPGNVTDAEKALAEKAILLEGQSKIITLDPIKLSIALRGGFRLVIETFGKEVVTMDITSNPKRIVVNGPDRLVGEIEEMLHNYDANTVEARLAALSMNGKDEELCPVCWTPPEEPFTTKCGHTYCSSCLVSQCTSISGFPICCLGASATCNLPLTLEELERALTSSDYEATLQSSFTNYIRSHPADFQYCSTPDCDRCYRTTSTVDPRIFTCDSCLTSICTGCNQPTHDGLTCAAYEAVHDGTNEFSKWKEENDVRDCPNCCAPIQKSSGCNHMKCRACGIHICWFCMKTFKTGEQTYGHMTKDHDGNWGLGRGW